MSRSKDSVTFAQRCDANIGEPRMQRLFGASGYFNVGYWTPGVTNLVAACDRLVDEMATAVPGDASLIIDVGCGLGAGTHRLAERFPKALVVGANISHWQLTSAKRRGVEAPVVMDAASMGIVSGSADAVLALESAHLFDTRAQFFAEAHRLLRPSGMLGVADMLFRDADAIGSWMVPHDNRITTLDAYASVLGNAGFADVTVLDITRVSWTPFCVAMRAVFGGHEDALREIEASLAHYVLAFARRAARQSANV